MQHDPIQYAKKLQLLEQLTIANELSKEIGKQVDTWADILSAAHEKGIDSNERQTT